MWDFMNITDPETGLSLMAIIQTAIIAIVSTLIWRIVTLAKSAIDKYLPEMVASKVDMDLMTTLHTAAVSALREVMLEGKNPLEAKDELVAYMKKSAKDAYMNALKNRTPAEVEEIFKTIALSKIPEVLPSFVTAGLKVNLPNWMMTEPMVIADPKVGPGPAVKMD